ncbi:MAG: ABC transporter permease [Chloroflexi bacterium]|nr:ABC transporter permease [Chloroflexota bacterium]
METIKASNGATQLRRQNSYGPQIQRFRRHRLGMIGLAFVLLIVLTGVFASVIATHPPAEQNLRQMRQPPSAEHFLGTDHVGRDVFSRVVYGAQIALATGLTLIAIEAIIGITIGVVSGYFGGWIDVFLSILVDVFWAFPPVVLALGIITTLGPGLNNVIIAIALISWAPFARVTRAKVQSLRRLEYVEASRSFGAGPWSILVRHIAPNVLPTSLVMATLMLPTALLAASSLSFLGFGAQPPTPEWGAILNEGREHLRTAPWISTYPGLAIVITVLGFNFLGDGLREALDPKLK